MFYFDYFLKINILSKSKKHQFLLDFKFDKKWKNDSLELN